MLARGMERCEEWWREWIVCERGKDALIGVVTPSSGTLML